MRNSKPIRLALIAILLAVGLFAFFVLAIPIHSVGENQLHSIVDHFLGGHLAVVRFDLGLAFGQTLILMTPVAFLFLMVDLFGLRRPPVTHLGCFAFFLIAVAVCAMTSLVMWLVFGGWAPPVVGSAIAVVVVLISILAMISEWRIYCSPASASESVEWQNWVREVGVACAFEMEDRLSRSGDRIAVPLNPIRGSEMNNPYTPPKKSGQTTRLSCETGMRRSYFWFVIATVLGVSFLLDMMLFPSPVGVGSLLIATGPFTLYFHYQWMGVLMEGVIFGVFTIAATFLFLVVPNRWTFVISIFGGVVWALSGFFWIAMLA